MEMGQYVPRHGVSQERGVGLAGNDVLAMYPFMGFLMCVMYFLVNRREVVGDYYQGREELEQSHDVKVIGQMGLRFFTAVSSKVFRWE